MNSNWLISHRSPYEIQGYAIKRHILARQTRFQLVELVESFDYGLLLLLDGVIQSSEVDEFIYHEALVHPAMCLHDGPARVLVIGGGEGATLREVLRHSAVEEVVMVDIDEELVDLCRDYLNNWHQGAFG